LIQEEWSGFRASVGKPVGRLWTAAWAKEGASGLYLAAWRRVGADHDLGQALSGAPEAMQARFVAEVANKQKEGYLPLGQRLRRGLPRWKDGSAVAVALAANPLAGSPTVLASVLKSQLQRVDSQAGVDSLWSQFQALRGRLEAMAEYGEEHRRLHAREVLDGLVASMKEALAC